jgi:hypothetical protein
MPKQRRRKSTARGNDPMPKPKPRRGTFFPDADEPKEQHDKSAAGISASASLRSNADLTTLDRSRVAGSGHGGRTATMTKQRKPITTVDEFRVELEALMGRASGMSIPDRLKILEAWCDYSMSRVEDECSFGLKPD